MNLISQRKIQTLLTCLSLSTLIACGSGIDTHNAETFTDAEVKLNLFSLGSDYPSDLVIPDIEGMRSTAFIASGNLSVVPVDLDTLQISTEFPVFSPSAEIAAVLGGYQRKVLVVSPTQALFLGVGGLIDFNPKTGEVYQSIDLTAEINPGELALSKEVDGQTTHSGAFNPSSADSIAVIGSRVFVSMSNLSLDYTHYIQGLLLVFDLNEQAPFLTPAGEGFVVMKDMQNGALFNPTALSIVQNQLIVTVTGASDSEFVDNVLKLTPTTNSALVKIDPQTLQITQSLNLGLIAANSSPLAVTGNGQSAFFGSNVYSRLYEVDLKNFSVLRGKDNPIILSDLDIDYISDQKIPSGEDILFVSSFNQDAVLAVDLQDPERQVLDRKLNFHLDPNPGLSGPGPMAFRYGEAGKDFNGPDLWVLTSSPGTLSGAVTY